MNVGGSAGRSDPRRPHLAADGRAVGRHHRRAHLVGESRIPRNPIVRFLWGVTEPIFRPFRRLLPPSRTGNIDLSPIFVLLIIFLLIRFLTRMAYSAQLAP